MRLGVIASEPCSRIVAYFHICRSKYKVFLMHVLKKNALHVNCTWFVRTKSESHLFYGGFKFN